MVNVDRNEYCHKFLQTCKYSQKKKKKKNKQNNLLPSHHLKIERKETRTSPQGPSVNCKFIVQNDFDVMREISFCNMSLFAHASWVNIIWLPFVYALYFLF